MHKKLAGVLPQGHEEIRKIFGNAGRDRENPGSGWTVREIFRGEEEEVLLMIISFDEGFQQRFYLRLVPRGGETLLKFDPVTTPCRTPSVLGAFEEVARLFEQFMKEGAVS